MGVSGQLIGYNAAMPALGWLVGTFFLPQLQAKFGLRNVLVTFLLIAAIAIFGFYLFTDFWAWMLLRLLFGGSLGLFYRAVEYSLNGIAEDDIRGRTLGIYSACFMFGLGLGATLHPVFGLNEFLPFGIISLSFILAIVSLAFSQFQTVEIEFDGGNVFSSALVLSIPIALLAVLAYGMYEDIPAYLLSVYALRNGLGETIAAYTLTATAIGALIFPIILGTISDKIGRKPILFVCAVSAMCLSAVVPFTLHNSTLFLGLIVVWAGMATGLYLMALTIIGDLHSGGNLARANASFGIVYAFGALIGPLINGFAIDTLNSHGMMVSAGVIFGVFILLSLMVGNRKLVSV